MVRPKQEENTNEDRYNSCASHRIPLIRRSQPNNWSPRPGRISDRFDPVTATLSDISLVFVHKSTSAATAEYSVFPNDGTNHATIEPATPLTPPKSHNPVSPPLTPLYPHRISTESQHIHTDTTDSGILGSPAVYPRLVRSSERGRPASRSVQETSGEEERGGGFGDESARVSEATGRRTEGVGRNDRSRRKVIRGY